MKLSFYDFSAGIVLQSYLPDSFLVQQELTNLGHETGTLGGAPIKIRLVKGANLSMEKVEASLQGGSSSATFTKVTNRCKFQTDGHSMDANPGISSSRSLGIGSHNLFDIAYAMLLRAEAKAEKYVCFSKCLKECQDHNQTRCPSSFPAICSYTVLLPQMTTSSIALAYLIRRLDENTAPENFLRHAFDLQPGTQEWQTQADLFSHACYAIPTIDCAPRRQQNRFKKPLQPDFDALSFNNEPDTDCDLKWAESLVWEWSTKHFETIPLVLGTHTIPSGVELQGGKDPSYPNKEIYRYALAGEEQLEVALQVAKEGFKDWSDMALRERLLTLDACAHHLRLHRADLIGAMIADTGKTMAEADAEVSEAIDFACYYRQNVAELHSMEDIQWKPKGPILVAPPWNFPCSIPAGGILAALAAGNSVIFNLRQRLFLSDGNLSIFFGKLA